MTSYGFLSTHPPTQCGLATFNAALLRHLVPDGSRHRAGVVRIVGSAAEVIADLPGVVGHLVNDAPDGPAVAAAALNAFDVAVVQHEYGIFGGRDGEDVLRVLAEVRVPVLVVFHTVLTTPSPHQRQLLERIADAAAAVVVMSRTAAERLERHYLVDPRKVSVIPHGATPNRSGRTPLDGVGPRTGRRPTVLTWGLIGPGKGIEWAVDAFAALTDLTPAPRYLVAGQTHPKVRERDGEAYRDSLRARAAAHGIAATVEFDDGYRDVPALLELVREADVILLPYESTEQITSGVLIEALAACRPVVATGFPHAQEMLADGAGLLVPQRDADAMAAALRTVLTEPGRAAAMSAAARRVAPELDWSTVADTYHALAAGMVGAWTPKPVAVAAAAGKIVHAH